MTLTLTTLKTQKDQPGGGWSFCKTLVLLKWGDFKRTGSDHYADAAPINQADISDIYHLYN